MGSWQSGFLYCLVRRLMFRILWLTIATVHLLCGCSSQHDFEVLLKDLAAKNVGQLVSIDSLISSAWDEFAVFGPYFPKTEACQILGLSVWRCYWLRYPKPQDNAPNLVVFLNKKDLVQTSFLARCAVQLHPHTTGLAPWPRRNGMFRVHQLEGQCINAPYALAQN